jgi:hypothetical protein
MQGTTQFSNFFSRNFQKVGGLRFSFLNRDANGAVLVYDITDEDSFHKVQTWVKELRYQPP